MSIEMSRSCKFEDAKVILLFDTFLFSRLFHIYHLLIKFCVLHWIGTSTKKGHICSCRIVIQHGSTQTWLQERSIAVKMGNHSPVQSNHLYIRS